MKLSIKIILLSLFVSSFALTASALDLNSARSQKIVTELPSGYIKANDPKGKALEKSVNAKRKKAYEKIAKKTKTDINVVGAQAHKKIMKKLNGK